MDVTGHDADLGSTLLARCDDAGAVRADETDARALFNVRGSLDHVKDGDAFSDADDHAFALDGVEGFRGLHDGLACERRRDVDDRRVGVGRFDGITDRVPHGEVSPLKLNGLTALAWRASADDGGAVLDHLVRMKATLAAGDALHDDLRVFGNPDRHHASPPPMRATMRSAPSAKSSAG